MTPAFALWLASFLAVAALLGIVMYMSDASAAAITWVQLICLSDLENDFINPHDSASRINLLVAPEAALHAGLSVLHLVTGRWVFALLNAPLVVYHARLWAALINPEAGRRARPPSRPRPGPDGRSFGIGGSGGRWQRREHLVDVTEIFVQLPAAKKMRLLKLFFYLLLFVISIYKLVESTVYMLMEGDGVEHAHHRATH
eukprot:SM000027S09664  [mRNA]  locus=s27:628536:629875:+ [translate_table: standard]